MDIGTRLRKLREEKELSQAEVAKLIGVGRTTYLKYESGENRPTRKLKELSQLFGVSMDYILGNSNSLLPNDTRQGYYNDPEVAELAEMLRTNPEYRIMFDASKNLSKEDIEIVINLIKGLKAKEGLE